MPQLFDVVYTPVQILGFPEPNTTVMARRVEAIDRVHAILWWLRSELGIVIDPVTMFSDAGRDLSGYVPHSLDCGCEIHLHISMHELNRWERMKRGVPAVPIAEVEAEPCPAHGDDLASYDSRVRRDWNGAFRAWKHDPKLPDTFRQGE
jgi:hypothetical protein